MVVPLQSECISRSENDHIQDPSSVQHDKFNCLSLILTSNNIICTLLKTQCIVLMTKIDGYFKIIIISNIKSWCFVVDYDKVGVEGHHVLLHWKAIIHEMPHNNTFSLLFRINVLRRRLLLSQMTILTMFSSWTECTFSRKKTFKKQEEKKVLNISLTHHSVIWVTEHIRDWIMHSWIYHSEFHITLQSVIWGTEHIQDWIMQRTFKSQLVIIIQRTITGKCLTLSYHTVSDQLWCWDADLLLCSYDKHCAREAALHTAMLIICQWWFFSIGDVIMKIEST